MVQSVHKNSPKGKVRSMYRQFYEELKEWEQKRIPEPLIVIGARQIGKTWIIRRFCEESYKNYIYINL